MVDLIRLSPEVYLSEGPISTIGSDEVAFLKAAVVASPRGRVRINAHPGNADLLHEMFIAIRADSYIRPHKHPGKSEAFHLIHGEVDIIIFDDSGEIRSVVRLAAGSKRATFYYRMSEPFFHTLAIRSDVLVVHEVTNGPFVPNTTILADFAPAEEDETAVASYLAALNERVAVFIGGQ